MAEKEPFSVKKYVEGFGRFRETYYREHESDLVALMDKPQGAKTLMIACSDSRIDPALKFGAAPGEIFMIRNVASLVPVYTADGVHHGTSAAIEFAVKSLEVKDIIILGHARCGGIHHLLNHSEPQEFLSPWMAIARAAQLRTRRARLQGADAQQMCEHEAIKTSLNNLMTFPWIAERVANGLLKLHGWHVDLAAGALHILDDTGSFAAASPHWNSVERKSH